MFFLVRAYFKENEGINECKTKLLILIKNLSILHKIRNNKQTVKF